MDVPFMEKKRVRLFSYIMDMLEMTGGIFVDFTTPLVEDNDLIDGKMRDFARGVGKGAGGKGLSEMLIKGLFLEFRPLEKGFYEIKVIAFFFFFFFFF